MTLRQEWREAHLGQIKAIETKLTAEDLTHHVVGVRRDDPRGVVRSLFAAASADHAQRAGRLRFVASCYRQGLVGQHRRRCGTVFAHKAATGHSSHLFLSPAARDPAGFLAYCFTDERRPEIDELRKVGAEKPFINVLDAAIEHGAIIPISDLPGAYPADHFWEKHISSRDGLLPLYANALEAALAYRRGWIGSIDAWVSDSKPGLPWFERVDARLNPRRTVGDLGTNLPDADMSVDQLLGWARVGPKEIYIPPALEPAWLWTYAKERMTWILLLGDRLVTALALQGLRENRRNPHPEQLGYLFFTLHQLFTGPVFTARGGAMNAHETDIVGGLELLGPRGTIPFESTLLDELLFRAWPRSDRWFGAREKRGATPSAAQMIEATPLQLAWNDVPIAEFAHFLEGAAATRGRELPSDAFGRCVAIRSMQKEYSDAIRHLIDSNAAPVKAEAAIQAERALTRVAVAPITTAVASFFPTLFESPLGVTESFTIIRLRLAKRKIDSAIRRADEIFAEARDHSLVAHPSYRTTFLVWDERKDEVRDPLGRAGRFVGVR